MKSQLRVRLSVLALVAYGTAVLVATVWPTPIDQGFEGAIARVLAVLHRHGLPPWLGYRHLEFSANVGMFVPLGFFISMLLPLRRWWVSILLCAFMSASIELTQSALLASRYATVDDVVANSLGGALGSGIAITLRLLLTERGNKAGKRPSVIS